MLNAPLRDGFLEKTGFMTRTWALFFTRLASFVSGGEPVSLKSFTVATVPNASDFPASLIFVSNETGGATIAFSDNTNWRRVQDRAIIS